MKLPNQRKTSALSDALSRRLNQYAWLAGAAGVSLLALPRAAEAEVVYTPTNVTVQAPGGIYGLDLNNDGIADFVFHGYGDGINDAFIEIRPSPGEVTPVGIQSWRTCRGTSSSYCAFAAALPHGAKIPGRLFAFEGVVLERANANSLDTGFWQNVRNHFLGLSIVISGQVHYGWARMNVKTQGPSVTAQITGYAYETIPNKPIGAGQTAATSTESVPGSLGSFARGAK